MLVAICVALSFGIGFALLRPAKAKARPFVACAKWTGGDRVSAVQSLPIFTSGFAPQGVSMEYVDVVAQQATTTQKDIIWVSLDCETTGLFEDKNGIISIGVVVQFPDGIRQERMFEMDPRYPGCIIDDQALAINGYKVEDFDGFEKPEVIMKKLVNFFQALPGDWRLVGSNPEFDVRFFNATLKRCGIGYQLTRRNVYDVAKLALQANDKGVITLPSAANGDVKTNLNTVVQVLGIGEQGTVHGALKDAQLALDAFLMLW